MEFDDVNEALPIVLNIFDKDEANVSVFNNLTSSIITKSVSKI